MPHRRPPKARPKKKKHHQDDFDPQDEKSNSKQNASTEEEELPLPPAPSDHIRDTLTNDNGLTYELSHRHYHLNQRLSTPNPRTLLEYIHAVRSRWYDTVNYMISLDIATGHKDLHRKKQHRRYWREARLYGLLAAEKLMMWERLGRASSKDDEIELVVDLEAVMVVEYISYLWAKRKTRCPEGLEVEMVFYGGEEEDLVACWGAPVSSTLRRLAGAYRYLVPTIEERAERWSVKDREGKVDKSDGWVKQLVDIGGSIEDSGKFEQKL